MQHYTVVVNLGEPNTTTDWVAVGLFNNEYPANETMDEINAAAFEGRLTIDRVIVLPIMIPTEIDEDVVAKLAAIQAGE